MTTIHLGQMNLIDRWPGAVNPNLGIPTGGWDNTTDNFNTADDTASAWSPPYPVGTKIMAYTDNSHNPGYYTMMYLMYHCYSATGGVIDASTYCISNGYGYCFHYDDSDAQAYAAEGADTSWVPYYVVASPFGGGGSTCEITKGSPLAIPCASLDYGESTAAYVSGYGDCYFWAWVGGVCPAADATFLQGADINDPLGCEITTDAHIIPGPIVVEYTGNTGIIEYAGISIGEDSTHVGVTSMPFGCAVAHVCTSAI